MSVCVSLPCLWVGFLEVAPTAFGPGVPSVSGKPAPVGQSREGSSGGNVGLKPPAAPPVLAGRGGATWPRRSGMTACGSTRTSPSDSWGEFRHPGASRDKKAWRAGPGADIEAQTQWGGSGKGAPGGGSTGGAPPVWCHTPLTQGCYHREFLNVSEAHKSLHLASTPFHGEQSWRAEEAIWFLLLSNDSWQAACWALAPFPPARPPGGGRGASSRPCPPSTFTHNMLAFGLNKKLCNDFLKKQAVIGNLDEGEC